MIKKKWEILCLTKYQALSNFCKQRNFYGFNLIMVCKSLIKKELVINISVEDFAKYLKCKTFTKFIRH